MKRNVIIIGAAGRDFHNFNTYFRDNQHYNVVAFTAAQIPDIDDRKYPAELAGELYPDGIPIHAEEELTDLIQELNVHECVFSYSDIPYEKVMAISAIVNSAGANFILLGPGDTMIESTKPVIAVGAVDGCVGAVGGGAIEGPIPEVLAADLVQIGGEWGEKGFVGCVLVPGVVVGDRSSERLACIVHHLYRGESAEVFRAGDVGLTLEVIFLFDYFSGSAFNVGWHVV